jgi:oligopeptide/dipeptide ABC transporter ATP-binding protein
LAENSSEKFLIVRDLTVTYFAEGGDPLRALDGVSLDVSPGEVVGILGESGCGKSTLANALVRLSPPLAKVEGMIAFRGRDLLTLPAPELRAIRGRDISLIGQDPALALNPVIKAGTQIEEVLRAHFSVDRNQRRARAIELLREVGFDKPEEIYSAYPHQLSGGQRQRIAIAQALSCRPALLIADEPISKLDTTVQAEIVELLKQIRGQHQTAILVVSHDPSLFAGFADRIAVMYAGRVVEVGTTSQIFRQPLHPYTQALVRLASASTITDAKPRIKFPAIEGESARPDQVAIGCRFEPRCADRMDICSHRYPPEFFPESSRPVNCFKYGE